MKVLALALVLSAPVLAQDRALLLVADDGGLHPSEVRAIRNVTASALRQRGLAIVDERSAEGVQPGQESVAALAVATDSRRVFMLHIGGRLGAKVPLTLEEIHPRTLEPVFSASLTAAVIEECDVVADRLAAAVVERRSPAETAQIRTVTVDEARPFAKKPGERFWFLGLPVPIYNVQAGGSPVGFSLGYAYEAENFRLEASVGGFSRGSEPAVSVLLGGDWIFFSSEVSPYLGGGIGYMAAGGHGGMGGQLEVGLEAFRLHSVRLLAGVEALIPFFDTGTYFNDANVLVQHRTWYPAAFLRLGF
jgi:hypothetical protein